MFKNNWLLILVIGAGLFFFFKQNANSEKVDEAKIKADLVHQLAENSQITPNNPDVSPDVVPDLANCPLCKGTKYITHADGHQTPCPYHGNSNDEIMDKLNDLEVRFNKNDEQLALLSADIKSTKGKLATIDQAHKPQLEKSTVLVANSCPCGCNHLVANCNCRPTCPGKRLEHYTAKPVIKSQTTVKTQTHTYTAPKPIYMAPQQPQIQYESYTYRSCSGGSCTIKRGFRPVRGALRIGRWR